MSPIIPQIVGFAAVAMFLLSYQQKKRARIIVINVTARVLYILQYLLLGAFEGAVLDVLGVIVSIVVGKKNTPFIKKHLRLFFILSNLLIIAGGLLLYQDVYSLLPIVGVLLQTGALWADDERRIRRLSLLSTPFWFLYNFISHAYGSSVGDVLTAASILIAMFKYREKKEKAAEPPAKGNT